MPRDVGHKTSRVTRFTQEFHNCVKEGDLEKAYDAILSIVLNTQSKDADRINAFGKLMYYLLQKPELAMASDLIEDANDTMTPEKMLLFRELINTCR